MPIGRPTTTAWKVLRTDLDDLADNDWADDVSDALPSSTERADLPFSREVRLGKNTEVEVMVFPYVEATGLLVDASTETFSIDVTFFNDPPDGSNIVGRTTSGEQIATRHAELTLCRFNVHYRFECDGADAWTLRLHTLSGTPTGADKYEVWYREVAE